MFEDITQKGVDLGFKNVVEHLKNRPLRVGTMCSGTESPMLALHHIASSKFTLRHYHVFVFNSLRYRVEENIRSRL
jgi:hypothetical protein